MVENKIEWPEPGRYIVAVSGGVDSMVLMNLLSERDYELVVAHVDHGVRDDSKKDAELVKQTADKLGFEFELKQLDLKDNFSEQLAREQRYKFFNQLKSKHQAKAIITAHHKDDLLETALINLSRGTGHRGLVSLYSEKILRPLINVNKKEVIEYAKEHNIDWHEDSTNKDNRYLRNFIRNKLLKDAPTQKSQLEKFIKQEKKLNQQIEQIKQDLIKDILIQAEPVIVDRYKFTMLPHSISNELVRDIFNFVNLDSRKIELITRFIKTAKQGNKFSLSKGVELIADDKTIKLI